MQPRCHLPAPEGGSPPPFPFLFFFFLCSCSAFRSFSWGALMVPTVSASHSRVRFFVFDAGVLTFVLIPCDSALGSFDASICMGALGSPSSHIEEVCASAGISLGSERTARYVFRVSVRRWVMVVLARWTDRHLRARRTSDFAVLLNASLARSCGTSSNVMLVA